MLAFLYILQLLWLKDKANVESVKTAVPQKATCLQHSFVFCKKKLKLKKIKKIVKSLKYEWLSGSLYKCMGLHHLFTYFLSTK